MIERPSNADLREEVAGDRRWIFEARASPVNEAICDLWAVLWQWTQKPPVKLLYVEIRLGFGPQGCLRKGPAKITSGPPWGHVKILILRKQAEGWRKK